MRATILAGLALAVAVPAGHAQLPALPTIGANWIGAGYPKVFYSSRDKLTFGVYYEQIRPPGFDDWDAPPPYRAKLSIDGQLATSGTRMFRSEARFPSLVPGWRLLLSFDAHRLAREDYYGVGNDTEVAGENVTAAQPHFYRSDVHRLFLRGEVQRHLVSGLRLLAGFHAERWRIDTLPGTTLLALDADPSIGTNTVEVTGRVGLVFDTRDDEVTPARGVLLQAILGFADSAAAGDVSYTRATVSAAAYVPITDRLLAAARVTAQTMSGSPPLGSLYLIDGGDRPYRGLGGASSHRGLFRHRFLGRDKLLSNLDLRYRLFGERRIASVTLLGFLDAGRVFYQEDLRLTTENLHVAGGLGLVVTIGRAGILGMTFAAGGDGVRPQVHTGWTF